MVSCFILSAGFTLSAQDYNVTVYDELRGFNRNYVNDIIRDANGFLWLATDRGIVRFDGVNFLEAPPPAGNQGDVLRLRLFGDNLYLIYRGTGAGYINLKTYRYISVSDRPVGDILQLQDGTHLIFFGDGRLVLQKNGIQVSEVMTSPDLAGTLHYRWGKVFVKTQKGGLLVAEHGDLPAIQKLDVRCCTWRVVFQDVGDRILVSSNEGFFELDSTLSARILKPLPESLEMNHTSWIQQNSTDAFFISKDSEVIQKRGDSFKHYPFQDKRISGLRTLFLYDSGNLLIGANGALLHLRFYPPSLTNLNQDKAAAFPEFRVRRKIITLAPDNFLLLGNPGFIQWKQGQFRNLLDSGFCSTYDGIVTGDDVYVTTENSFEKYSLSKGKLQTILADGITSSDNFYTVTLDSVNNSFVLAGRETMFRYYPRQKRALRIKSIGNSSARVVKRVPGKPLWFVGTTDGLYVLDDELKQVNRMRKQDGILHGTTISDLLFIDSANIWVTHERGAEKINIEKFVVTDSVPASVFNDSRVTALLKDGRNNLWFSTYNGILGFDPISRATVKLGLSSNLINREFNYKAAAVLPDGRLMFGGLDGYDLIDPTAFSFNISRPDGIVAGYRRSRDDDSSDKDLMGAVNPEEIVFNTEHESLRIYLTTRQLLNSSTNRYEFRLNEGAWNNLEGSAHLDIYKLRPGTYSLEFRAFDLFGALITFPPIKLQAKVVFYKSTFFIVSVLLALLVSLLGIIMIIRYNQIREVRMKETISMDLHDEVGTMLTRALMVSRQVGSQNSITRLQDYLSDALFSLRTYIRTMNKKTIHADEFASDLQDFLHATLEDSEITYRFRTEIGNDPYIGSSLCRDIKLIYFELTNNMIKHSNATEVSVVFKADAKSCSVDFSDNGHLKSINDLNRSGYGLLNIEKRAERNGGTAQWMISSGGTGLRIVLNFKNY